MSNQHHGLLAAERGYDSASLNDAYLNFSVASSGRVSGLIVPPATPAFIGNVAHDDIFGTTEAAEFGLGLNLFDDNGTGEDTGSGFSVVALNGNAGAVGHQVTLASGALLTLNADGTFDYDPNHVFDSLPGADSGASNHGATDSFTYTLTGGSVATVTIFIVGLDSNDNLIGTNDADELSGGAGNDTIVGLGGNDRIDGGAGDNTAVYTGALGEYTVNLDATSHIITVEDDRDTTVVNDGAHPANAIESNIVSDGTDALTNIQHLQFSDATESFTFDGTGQVVAVAIAHNGGLTVTSQFDPSDTSPWNGIVTTNDSAGNLLSQVIDNDAGDTWTNEFGIGNSEPYVWATEHSDADGHVLTRFTTFADGTHTLTLFDVANQFAWSDATITFDANWNITDATGNADPPPPPPPPPGPPDPNEPLTADAPRFTLADFQAALDTAVWFATPYDPNKGGPGDLTLSGGPANETLYGFNGNDRISGGGGNDFIVGGRGDDLLTGGTGDDHFLFHAGDGHDSITDFTAGDRSGDVIELRGYGLTSFEQLHGLMSQVEDDTVITFDPQNTLTLHGVNMADLNAGDFSGDFLVT